MSDSRKGWAAIGMAARSVALRGAQQRTAAHKPTAVEQTKPNRSPGHPPIADAQILLEAMRCGDDDFSGRVARSAAHSGAQQRSAAHRPRAVKQTKPTGGPGAPPVRSRLEPQMHGRDAHATLSGALALTSRQLAAARLVAQGLRSSEIAARLGTIPQTVNRWKHLPQFQAELRRVHDMLVLT